MTKQYAIDVAKKLFRENQKSYYVIEVQGEYSVIDQNEYNKNVAGLKNLVVFEIS